jgi:hypothetical protein
MVISVECPWCAGPVGLADEATAVACDDCGIVADIATDALAHLAEAA